MNDKAFRVLEYGKIVRLLEEEASSVMAKEQLSKLVPFCVAFDIENAQNETAEAVHVITRKGSLSLGSFYDIKGNVVLADKGAVLTPKALLEIMYNLYSGRKAATFLKTDLFDLVILDELAGLITVHKNVEEEIDRCIVSEEEIADHASPALRDIRRNIARHGDAVRAKLNSILASDGNRTMLQDTLFTMRQGRYVIPVKLEYKAKFPGIVHDQSSTGATLFIEPQSIVDLGNQLRELELKERAEIERILATLSAMVAAIAEQILANQDILIRLDTIFAKGKLAAKQKAVRPRMNTHGYINIKSGRHPLIDPEKVVPSSLHLGKDFDTLVVTGPNTGGKTVTLKTVGLFQMMAQAGLHVPAEEGTELAIFEKIYADIGDEQSIEQSLSTFSSHMKNIVNIVEHAGERSLVLLDELGAGTDPTEGAALAISVLDHLYKVGSKTLATTHYTELKKYAIATKGIENASVEFNVETLSPTYKLHIGTAGRSNAFEISRKLGLPDYIIKEARNLIGDDDVKFEEVLSKIEKDRVDAESERDQAIRLNIEIKKMRDEIDIQKQRLAEQKEKIIAKAREEAREMIRDAKEFVDETQKELRRLEKIEDGRERNKEYEKVRTKVREKSNKHRDGLKQAEHVNVKPLKAEEIKIGDVVKVISLDQKASVLVLPDSRGEIQVQAGLLKMKVKLKDITKVQNQEAEKNNVNKKYAAMYTAKTASISTSISLRGMNLDDATVEIDKYLDDAYMAGLSQVSIIHGKGEGILKAGLRDFFKHHHLIDTFKPAPYNEGGDGCTIVYLKK